MASDCCEFGIHSLPTLRKDLWDYDERLLLNLPHTTKYGHTYELNPSGFCASCPPAPVAPFAVSPALLEASDAVFPAPLPVFPTVSVALFVAPLTVSPMCGVRTCWRRGDVKATYPRQRQHCPPCLLNTALVGSLHQGR